MVTNKQEYQYGLKAEIELKPLLEKFCGVELSGTKQYDTFDFVGENITIEIKSYFVRLLIYSPISAKTFLPF